MLFSIAAYCIVLSLVVASAVVANGTTARKRNVNGATKDMPNGQHDKESKKPLNGQKIPEAVSDTPVKTRPFVLYAILLMALLGGAATGAYFATGYLSKSTNWAPPTCQPPTVDALLNRYKELTNTFTYPILTTSPKAQRLFDIGMLQAWNFNQPEALRAFQLASEEDPAAAMPFWGQAYALGPGANRDVTSERKPYPSFAPEDFPAVYKAAQAALKKAQIKAIQLDSTQARPHPSHAKDPPNNTQDPAKKELALAVALAMKRFPEGSATGAKRAAAEKEYAEAMQAVGVKLSDSVLIAMAAEAFMNLSPWDYYNKDKSLKETATIAEELINQAIALEPMNALALHLHIHIAEASSPQRGPHLNAARAESSAARMLDAEASPLWGTAKLGHLVHMPSHTFVRIGRWADAVTANVAAWRADVADATACQSPYEPEHNTDMLIYAANMAGQYKIAEEYSEKIRLYPADIPTAYSEDYGNEWVHLILTYVIQGKWNEILNLPGTGPPAGARGLCPTGGYEYSTAVYHYARTLALAAKAEGARVAGDMESAISWYSQGAVTAFMHLREAEGTVVQEEGTVPGEWPGIYACDYKKLARILVKTAEARLALMQGDTAGAEANLRQAFAIEEGLGYMEPPRQYQPTKHCLGYVLMRAGKNQTAAEVFVEDMMEHPNNGYALLGVLRALSALGRDADAAQLAGVHEAAWASADAPLESPCPAFSRLITTLDTGFKGRRLMR
ncbi:hypothetical protein COCSUDRAFT_47568 [Coccomyxa subellipsoidea C-169]|uniref:TPR-like protein n=1 Tax=Coccomyxa subellipsoidea (strain C-169) TaxID=574566 RepID=I0YXZ4_COCSC|nr:hypothetical protein COCSUDRAFT_47568 [Coccomyxa subellipsoidea C-169]EIE23263.1 hypothetical protein COCSUDRAFT_47568 [Coccomyxa subellipsoidea C-169]|eukprot:XP_005647807.1 hypothetical protein COCSUDRAFT_47568 [Coccomyxa subellipsoidea C-169]